MTTAPIEQGIKAKARELLESGKVECVIGYERATDGLTARPFFVYDVPGVDRMVFDRTCVHNLTKYVLNRKAKTTAIVAKPCDSRSINLLINEKQFDRGRVYIIGIGCPGMSEVRWNSAGDGLDRRCQRCTERTPVVYDHLVNGIDATNVGPSRDVGTAAAAAYAEVEALEKMTADERQSFWAAHFSNCIRCHACRQVCPGCYCSECFVDQLDPTWVGIRKEASDAEMWNIIRAFHLAGRCSSCNECERVCPVGIPLSLLNRKLEQDTARLFDFRAGMSSETTPPFATFKKDEHLGTVE